MPTTNNIPTLVKAANQAVKALADAEASIAKRTFNDTVAQYVTVSETFGSLEAALKAAHEGKWNQATFIKAATAAGVKVPSQSTVSRIQAMSMHTPQRASRFLKDHGPVFNQYTTFLGKLQRNEIDDKGDLTPAGAEALLATADRRKARMVKQQQVTLGSFDFTETLPAKATKVSKLETLLRMARDLDVQIAAVKADLTEAQVKQVETKVRDAETAAIKALADA